MAYLTKCSACGGQVSTSAPACPHCGHVRTGNTAALKLLGAIGVVVFVVVAIWSVDNDTSTSSPPPQLAESAKHSAQAPASDRSAQKASPNGKDAQVTADRANVTEISERVKQNAEHLKKYYATPEELTQSESDADDLVALVARHKIVGERDDVTSKADHLEKVVERQTRDLFASVLTEGFIRNGIDMDVTPLGKDGRTLRMKYALMSRPFIYQLQNTANIEDQARKLGFTKVIYTDGFNETWTVHL